MTDTNTNHYIDGIHLNDIKKMDLTRAQRMRYSKIMYERAAKIHATKEKRKMIMSIGQSKLAFLGKDMSDTIKKMMDENADGIMSKNKEQIEAIFDWCADTISDPPIKQPTQKEEK